MPKNKSKYARDVAKNLSRSAEQLKFVLSALIIAVQERIGEDIILWPREKVGRVTQPARVYNCKWNWKKREIWQHIIFYDTPAGAPPLVEELLRVTLDVAHEVGHLLLERGPGQIPARVGISQNDMGDVKEVEADWFALCVLQMYGFIFPP